MINISATFTCGKCKESFRSKFSDAIIYGCNCGAKYEHLSHIPVIVVDSRETRSGVPAELQKLGVEIDIRELEVGDYVVSDRMAMERKTPEDLLQDWIGAKEFFGKLIDLRRAYRKPVLLLEGYQAELYELRMIDPYAVQGMLFTIARLGIPMIETLTTGGTAKALSWFADKEQSEKKRIVQLHGKRSHLTPSEQLVYIIAAIPGLGSQTSIALLQKFGSIEAVSTASTESLMEVDGIGKKTAEMIRDIMVRKYG